MRIHARHYATGRPIELAIAASRIASVTEPSGSPDLTADWVAPSFFDIQVNGCLGISFNSDTLTADDVRSVADVCRRHGVGGFCPTLITASTEALTHGFGTLARLCDNDANLARTIPAFHLEGPYIAGEDGPRSPSQSSHSAAGLGRVPPLAGRFAWPDSHCDSGPRIAGGARLHRKVGHERRRCLDRPHRGDATRNPGCRASRGTAQHASRQWTHAILPRHPNYIWEQLAADELSASVIADGYHLPASVLKSILHVKTPERTILISDAGTLAGLPPGRYECWGQDFEVHPAGKIVMPETDYLAGAAVFLDTCVGNVLNLGLGRHFASGRDGRDSATGMAACLCRKSCRRTRGPKFFRLATGYRSQNPELTADDAEERGEAEKNSCWFSLRSSVPSAVNFLLISRCRSG